MEVWTIVGTLMGITNTIGTVPGFIGPAAVGAITQGNVSAVFCAELPVKKINPDMIQLCC